MLRNVRRNFLSLLLVLSIIVSNLTMISAQETPNEYLVKEFQINRDGVTTNFVVDAVPDSMLNIQIFYDGGKKPEFNNSQSVMENVAYVNQFNVPESGTVEFSFKNNEKTGMYTLRLSGQVYSASFDITGDNSDNSDNSIPTSCSGGLFAIFRNDYEVLYPEMKDYYTTYVVLSDWEDGEDVYEYARSIKQKLDKQQPGRRAIFLGGSWNEYLYRRNNVNAAWLDTGAQKAYDKLYDFFKAFYEIGGTVDYAFSDLEAAYIPYDQEELKQIVSDPRYVTEIRPLLEERGYRFIDETSPYWNSTELDMRFYTAEENYILFYVMGRRLYNYMDYAFYQPIAKWFPNIKFSEYAANDVGGWDDWGLYGYHNDFPGTHNSLELYMARGDIVEFNVDFEPGKSFLGTDFDDLAARMKRMYYIYAKDENAKIQPNIYTYNGQPAWVDSPYVSELYYHTAMYNPDPFHVFSVKIVNGKFDYDVWREDGITLNLIKHINDVIGDSQPEDRKVIDCGEMLYNKYYLLSGMTVKDKNIYRITPDMERESELETIDDFLVSETETEVTFAVNGQTVTFPQGKIIRKSPDKAVPELGYWVETPKDVFPVQELATPGTLDGSWVANTKVFSDRLGMEANTLKKDESYTFVLRYDNKQYKPQDVTVFIGEYDENGNALSYEILGQESAIVGGYGRFVFKLPKLESDTHSVRIFTWDNLSNLKPLKLVREIECED